MTLHLNDFVKSVPTTVVTDFFPKGDRAPTTLLHKGKPQPSRMNFSTKRVFLAAIKISVKSKYSS